MIYLIDFENTQNRFLESDKLKFKEGDKVYICWENTKHPLLDGGRLLDWQTKGVTFEKLLVFGGRKSATDMQLSSWAGYLFAQDTKAVITLVSDDLALQPMEAFWKDRQRKLTVLPLKGKEDVIRGPKKVKFSPEMRQEIHNRLQGDSRVLKEDIPSLMKIVKRVTDKVDLQEKCQKNFSYGRGRMYYELIATGAGI